MTSSQWQRLKPRSPHCILIPRDALPLPISHERRRKQRKNPPPLPRNQPLSNLTRAQSMIRINAVAIAKILTISIHHDRQLSFPTKRKHLLGYGRLPNSPCKNHPSGRTQKDAIRITLRHRITIQQHHMPASGSQPSKNIRRKKPIRPTRSIRRMIQIPKNRDSLRREPRQRSNDRRHNPLSRIRRPPHQHPPLLAIRESSGDRIPSDSERGSHFPFRRSGITRPQLTGSDSRLNPFHRSAPWRDSDTEFSHIAHSDSYVAKKTKPCQDQFKK